MLEHVFNTGFGIDELFFKDVVNELTPFPGRMAFITTICIMLLNVGHLGVLSKSIGVKRVSQGLFHIITIAVSYTHLDVYKRQVGAVINIRNRIQRIACRYQ